MFTTASIFPNLAIPAAIAVPILAGFVTSSSVTKIRSGFSAARLWSGLRMVATTFHPSSANFLAAVWPSPVEQPVIKTVFIIKILLYTRLFDYLVSLTGGSRSKSNASPQAFWRPQTIRMV
ncbi:hypothetical protein OMP40_35310 [Cohnella rhizosphaerae]|uniref:Uncharacterized protein n=1 Tax=Cohnella rhizosphaerae TaxID=1457232 RepID=A0A9X4KZ86_9BACL|nr:hypothetical protein [Cohnella rhizosphaerae]MDG0813975.1 hypothetical protein [Cohnella rhizosphaerae]